jgi:hypothetical protein
MAGRITHDPRKGEAVCDVPSQPKSIIAFIFWPVETGIRPVGFVTADYADSKPPGFPKKINNLFSGKLLK